MKELIELVKLYIKLMKMEVCDLRVIETVVENIITLIPPKVEIDLSNIKNIIDKIKNI